MFSNLTRSRIVLIGAAVGVLLVELLIAPPLGSVQAILQLSALGLVAWVLLGALSGGVIVVELLRSIIPKYAAWNNRQHFRVVGLVAGALGLVQVLGLFMVFHGALK